MPIDTEFDLDAGLRIQTARGRISLEEARAVLDEVYGRPDFESGMDVLWDLRDATLDFSTDDVREMAEFVSGKWGLGGTSRAALVVKQDFDFGLARMYEQLIEVKSSNELMVFRTLQEARRWLSGDG